MKVVLNKFFVSVKQFVLATEELKALFWHSAPIIADISQEVDTTHFFEQHQKTEEECK